MINYFSIEENMKGKVAFMTGGTTGIGRACVRIFVEAGVNVVFVGRSVEKGRQLEETLNTLGKGKAVYMECDVTNYDRLKACIDETARQFGRLDTLLNCAGYFPAQKPVDAVSIEDYTKLLRTNLVPYFVTAKAALPYLRRVRGSIINIGSVLGTLGDEGAAAYCAAKGGIHTMTRSLAIDEARFGVRVNEVKPGHINTEMFEKTTSEQADPEGFIKYSDGLQWMERGGEPEEIAFTVLFLASDWASFITGEDIHVTGGFNIGEGPKPKNPFLSWAPMEVK
ncbi:MAG: SDR family oxidoreductase [Oscillospiraceae bacterium]|nr:SDR family oxidoreductase [Oscillospiraceae bacterium]